MANSKEEQVAEKKTAMRNLYISGFLSVAQTVITIQSEPLLIKELAGGDIGLTARMLANTQGLVGVLGIIINQIGGKFSDALGRKQFLALGPVANILFGLLIYRNSHKRQLVLPLRVLRAILTTFSSTVMLTAALSDVAQGAEFGAAISKMGAAVGAGIVITPFVEALFLQRSNSPRTAYLLLSMLGCVHAAFVGLSVPETLRRAQRKTLASAMQLSSINPFGFLNIFRRGSTGLQKMICIQTLQMFLEGKNLSDLVELWKREHLKWTVEGSRNYVMIYGTLSILSGVYVTPYFLKNLTARGFTSATNLLNLFGFLVRGAREQSWIFLLAVIPMLPGVNGASATALKSISTDLATSEGFGKGEFAAWTNNLRALAGAIATVLYGNYYSWCKRTGTPAGTTFVLAGLIGAALPELLLRLTKDSEMQRSKDEVPEAA